MDWFIEEIYDTYPVICDLNSKEIKSVNIRVMRLETTKISFKDEIEEPQLSINLLSEASFDKSAFDLSPNQMDMLPSSISDGLSQTDSKESREGYSKRKIKYYKSEKSPCKKPSNLDQLLIGVLKKRRKSGTVKLLNKRLERFKSKKQQSFMCESRNGTETETTKFSSPESRKIFRSSYNKPMKRFKSTSKLNCFKEPMMLKNRKKSDKTFKNFDFSSQNSTNLNSNSSFCVYMMDRSEEKVSFNVTKSNFEFYKSKIPIPISKSITRLQNLVSPYTKKCKRRNLACYEKSENCDISHIKEASDSAFNSPKLYNFKHGVSKKMLTRMIHLRR